MVTVEFLQEMKKSEDFKKAMQYPHIQALIDDLKASGDAADTVAILVVALCGANINITRLEQQIEMLGYMLQAAAVGFETNIKENMH